MTRFNKPTKAPRATGLITTTTPAPTALGGAGYTYDTVSQLVLLAANNFVAQETFHEEADERDERFIELVQLVTLEHPDLIVKMLPWLRSGMRMRTSSIIGAAEAAKILSGTGQPPRLVFTRTASGKYDGKTVHATARMVVANTLARADEPTEFAAYWVSRFGQKMPRGVKRGLADAILRLYNEKAALKYDASPAGRWSMGGVIEYCGRKPDDIKQRRLFEWLVTKSKNRSSAPEVPEELTMIRASKTLRRQAQTSPDVLLNPARLSLAGLNWEDTIPQAVEAGLSKKDAWTAMIPSMNVMALIRNLRNFDEAGIDNAAVENVINKITNPLDVMRSKVLPMRMLSAYRAAPSDRWKWPLQVALDASLTNIPQLPGRTLILVDTSGSMHARLSKKSELLRRDAAVLFGLALARNCAAADVVSFSVDSKVFPLKPGENVLAAMQRWSQTGFNYGYGTYTYAAVHKHFAGHDRIIVLTDEQAADGHVFASVPDNTMCITFNLAGHKVGHAPAGSHRRVTIGGLSDGAFGLLPVLEGAAAGRWPWDAADQWGEV